MKFCITQIDFDFQDDDFELPPLEQEKLIQECKLQVWDVENEDELADKISDHYGWCVFNLDYVRVTK